MLHKLLNAPSAHLNLVALLLPLVTPCLRPFIFALLLMLRPFVGLTTRSTPTSDSLLGGAADLARSNVELVLENVLLRQQLIVLRHQASRPQLNNSDCFLLALLASKLRTWKKALLLVQPDSLLRWHRSGFRLLGKRKAMPGSSIHQRKISAETIEWIKQLAQDN